MKTVFEAQVRPFKVNYDEPTDKKEERRTVEVKFLCDADEDVVVALMRGLGKRVVVTVETKQAELPFEVGASPEAEKSFADADV